MDEILTISIKDLEEDLEELLYLYKDYLNKLILFNKEIKTKKNDINNFKETKFLTHNYIRIFTQYVKEINEDINSSKKSVSQKNLIYLQNKKLYFYNLLRTNIAQISSLIISTDWQSPTFNHSLYSLAGRQSGKIKHTISDYKRDVHLDEQIYEKIFVNEYIDLVFKLPIHAYAVNSGMAAFITILNFLITENKIGNKILIGKSIYFQNKEIIKRFFSDKVFECDENDINIILGSIKKYSPSVIILDTLCNSSNIASPNLPGILNYLVKNIKNETSIIIDNTTMPIFFQPFKFIKGKNKKINLFVLESLNKFHQFGLDRTTGGIILAYGKNAGKLYYTRQNSGTNILDISIHMLPTPNNKFLTKRILRLGRNAKYLAESLQKEIEKYEKLKIEKINYPSLQNHPSFEWSQNNIYHGSFFSLQFKKIRNPRIYNKFQNHVIKIAKDKKVQISVGTSFGFNNTRIYLTSLRSDYGTPFIRVSVGTENFYEITKIKEVFVKAMLTF